MTINHFSIKRDPGVLIAYEGISINFAMST